MVDERQKTKQKHREERNNLALDLRDGFFHVSIELVHASPESCQGALHECAHLVHVGVERLEEGGLRDGGGRAALVRPRAYFGECE